jgi:ribosome-associated protein
MQTEKCERLKGAEGTDLAKEAVKLLLEKLALDVTMFDVKDYTSITDYYVNATGKSLTHVASLADDAVEHFANCGYDALRVEGKRGNSWILVDFGSLIVNIFDKESRGFYNFDRLLPAESKMPIDDLVKEVDAKFEINKKKDI